jgi:hypothetical protein
MRQKKELETFAAPERLQRLKIFMEPEPQSLKKEYTN